MNLQFRNCKASVAIPPVVLNTSGMKVAFSIYIEDSGIILKFFLFLVRLVHL